MVLVVLVIVFFVVWKFRHGANKKKEENAEEKAKAEIANAETPKEHADRVMSRIRDIKSMVSTERLTYLKKNLAVLKETREVRTAIDKMLTEYVEEYSNNDNLDEDFAKLIAVYKESKKRNSEGYLSALQACKNKGLSQTKQLVELSEKEKRLAEEEKRATEAASELGDVEKLKSRRKWKNPGYKKLYDELYALENDPIYKEIQEKEEKERREREEKEEKWKDYSSRSISCWKKTTLELCRIGRNKDKVAIWSTKTLDGQVISIDDVAYFQITEETETNTKTWSTSTSQPSKLGTAINESIWGTAAAVSSAIQKSQQIQNSKTASQTARTAHIYFNYETGIAPLEIKESGLHFGETEVDKLIAMMPEKQR